MLYFKSILFIGLGVMSGLTNAIQEFGACARAFECTTYCSTRGFNDRVCKMVEYDDSPMIDGTQKSNKRVCLCSESRAEFGNSATGEYSYYWFSPGNGCVRNGSDQGCKAFCSRLGVPTEDCQCRLSSCQFPKNRLGIHRHPQVAVQPGVPSK